MIGNFEDARVLRWRSGDRLRRPRGEISFMQYAAPEYRLADLEGLVCYDHAVDIWAIGIVIYELHNGWVRVEIDI
jgi:serine/threonine protein kinase